jgi:hypothetical protein
MNITTRIIWSDGTRQSETAGMTQTFNLNPPLHIPPLPTRGGHLFTRFSSLKSTFFNLAPSGRQTKGERIYEYPYIYIYMYPPSGPFRVPFETKGDPPGGVEHQA